MAHTLNLDKCQELSKQEIIKLIRDYCLDQKEGYLKDNLSDEDFMSASWSLKQAHNSGYIKMCNKLINFLPKEING